MKDDILNFYKKTSYYTDLGLYKEWAEKLPDDIRELCNLQRHQIIHPIDFKIESIKNDKNSYNGDMTKLDLVCLKFENDLFPNAISMVSELLRRDANYSAQRDIKNKIHVCCREQAILLASILKAKGFSARVRSGFCKYINPDGELAGDHWLVEYYNIQMKRWILVDADMFYDEDTLKEHHIDFDLCDVPLDKYIFGAEAYLGLRSGKYSSDEIYFASNPRRMGLKAAIRVMFYDFHSVMNDEIPFVHMPKYLLQNGFELSDEEYKELDNLANLMLDVDKNFDELKRIWKTNHKFRILAGGFEGY